MSYWIKYFKDGTQERGTDAELWGGKKSWRNRHKDIRSAVLFYAGVTIEVSGDEIWQKDQYSVPAGSNVSPTRIARSLGVRVKKDDVGKCAFVQEDKHKVYTLGIADAVEGNHIAITLEDVGSWLILKVSRVGTVGLIIEERYRV